jgi:hypothetical protein
MSAYFYYLNRRPRPYPTLRNLYSETPNDSELWCPLLEVLTHIRPWFKYFNPFNLPLPISYRGQKTLG